VNRVAPYLGLLGKLIHKMKNKNNRQGERLSGEEVAWSNDAIRSGRILGFVGIPFLAFGAYLSSVHKYGFRETNDAVRQELSQIEDLNLYRVFGV